VVSSHSQMVVIDGVSDNPSRRSLLSVCRVSCVCVPVPVCVPVCVPVFVCLLCVC